MIDAPCDGYDSWRHLAWRLLRAEVEPDRIAWRDAGAAQDSLILGEDPPAARGPAPSVPAAFSDLARSVALHRDPARWSLLYRVLWRVTHGEPRLLGNAVDVDALAATRLAEAVRKDIYRVHAFVRFHPVADPLGERWVAWHRPDFPVLAVAVPHFVARYAAMRWTIMTPDATAHWDLEAVSFGPGVPIAPAHDDAVVDLWRTYYASVFNPARLKPKAMLAQLPRRHWPTLPEAEGIPELIATAAARTADFLVEQPPTAEAFLPPASASWEELRAAAAVCRGCPLHAHATRTVFGEGPTDARLALVGEQPGDEEDRVGRPFVGPAGRVLDAALADAGIARGDCYVSNAVKHFKYVAVDGARVHKTPVGEVPACRAWILTELDRLKPRAIVALGATAGRSLLGRAVAVERERGRPLETRLAPHLLLTAHPASILRQPDPQRRREAYARLVADLRLARALAWPD